MTGAGKEVGLCVTVVSGPGAGQRRRLDSAPVVIGRASVCDVVVPDLCASRRHARIAAGECGWRIEDLGSRHGTFVGGERVRGSRMLYAGDEIAIAGCRIRVAQGAGAGLDARDTEELSRCHPVIAEANTAPTRLARLERDLGLAGHIQRALLLSPPPTLPGLDIAVAYEPAFDVGGDFYDFAVRSGGRLAVAVGDVAGQAVSAALYMARLGSELRRQLTNGAPPAQVIARVNAAMVALGDGHGMFSTLVCGVIDGTARRMVFTNAGHVPPILGRDGKARALDGSRAMCVPVGIMPQAEAGQASEGLAPGDVLVFATDGIVEARGSGGEYGLGRLMEVISATSRGDSASAVVDAILADVRRHQGAIAQTEGPGSSLTGDDITAVAIRLAETGA
ncbi:MAG TPA: SpoIIE family protein phosphatase [Kofleriaceae bacterium]|nr:SpoIIE family protein phosphatase [Kofleriaceae bacterium]